MSQPERLLAAAAVAALLGLAYWQLGPSTRTTPSEGLLPKASQASGELRRGLPSVPIGRQLERSVLPGISAALSNPNSPFAENETWTEDSMYEAAEEHMRLDEVDRERVLAGFRPWIAAMDFEEAQGRFGESLTLDQFDWLKQVEAPFNSDLEALGILFADDLAQARQDIWVNGLYDVHKPPVGIEPRPAMVGESRIAFPQMAFYYRVDSERFPHLGESTKKRQELMAGRAVAIKGALDAFEL
ncbi:MAG: hypothetical protein P1V81_17415 [Planctomycetota bacterium]|nr:hypothetical protein [Planctomycetota bacterium]